MNALDRRISPRLNTEKLAVVDIKLQKNQLAGQLKNISQNGACLEVSKKLPIGARLEINLKPSGDSGLQPLLTKIVWRKPLTPRDLLPGMSAVDAALSWSYGLLFYQLAKESSAQLQAFLNGNSSGTDRRNAVRRTSGFTPLSNTRQYERRASKTFLIKANRLARSFDKWTTYHTYLRPMDTIQHPYSQILGQRKIMLGSNSYLGLSTHPRVKEAAIKAIEKYGVGSGGVPVLSGTTVLHDELCEVVARFKGTESAILFPSGYTANFACLSTMFGDSEDTLLNDERNHASIIDGARMSKAKVRFFKHNNMDDLRMKLEQYTIDETKMIIVDGVFSMDGDLCDLAGVYSLARKYNALVMVDDAHSTGVVGQRGRGTAEHFGLLGKIDLTTVTLSKAIGAVGGAICGSKALIKYLVHLSRQFIFSTSLPPAICAAAIAAIHLIEEEPQMVEKLRSNVKFLSDGLTKIGFKIVPTQSAIIPIIIGDELTTYKLTHLLDEQGVFVNAVSRPAVPRELSRLRVSPNAQHSEDDLAKVVKAFKIVGEKLRII